MRIRVAEEIDWRLRIRVQNLKDHGKARRAYARVLTLHPLTPAGYYSYLVLYNVIYVSPMALIVLVFAWTLGARKLAEYGGRVLKLLSGIMMLSLGAILLLWPNLLHSAVGAAALLVAAGGLTVIVVAADGWWQRRHPSGNTNVRPPETVDQNGGVVTAN